MYESCGGSFQEGSSQGNGYQLIREYFQQKSCKHCSRNYSPDGIEFIREEPGLVVVRVGCSNCGQPLGIALVGMSGGGNQKSAPEISQRRPSLYGAGDEDIPYPADWSKGDMQRLSNLSRITYDDVLDAHKFFSNLGSDWSKHLPRRGKRTGRPISAG
jgi:hypothetical protein